MEKIALRDEEQVFSFTADANLNYVLGELSDAYEDACYMHGVPSIINILDEQDYIQSMLDDYTSLELYSVPLEYAPIYTSEDIEVFYREVGLNQEAYEGDLIRLLNRHHYFHSEGPQLINPPLKEVW